MNGPTERAYGTDPHKGLISLCAHDTPQGRVTATTLPLKKASACSPVRGNPCLWREGGARASSMSSEPKAPVVSTVHAASYRDPGRPSWSVSCPQDRLPEGIHPAGRLSETKEPWEVCIGASVYLLDSSSPEGNSVIKPATECP